MKFTKNFKKKNVEFNLKVFYSKKKKTPEHYRRTVELLFTKFSLQIIF